ncbi:MAG: PatB family C-S lyase [Clostridiales bacterium]|nr:PatB family C-S lyase [Clostridiales bacterium]
MISTEFNQIGYNRIKWHPQRLELIFGKSDVTPLWVADMDYATAPAIIKAVEERLKAPSFGYEFQGDDYFDAFIKWHKLKDDWDINKEDIISVESVLYGMAILIDELTDVGDNILINTPVYGPFKAIPEHFGRNVVDVPLVDNGDRYIMDLNAIEEAMKNEKIKIFIMANPHNPTGRVWTVEELVEIGNLCKKYDVFIISDEIHSNFTYPGYRFTPFDTLKDFEDITITITSAGKTFNIPSVAKGILITKINKVKEIINNHNTKFHLLNANGLSRVIFKSAYEDGAVWFEELMVVLEGNREYIIEFFKNEMPWVKIHKPESTFLLWIDFSQKYKSQKELNEILVNKVKVGLNSAEFFGHKKEGFARMNFATSREILEEVLINMKKYL